MDGFGRKFRLKKGGEYTHWLGYWNNDELNGYGFVNWKDGTTSEGLFDKGLLHKDKSSIKSYNPNVHLCSMKFEMKDCLLQLISKEAKHNPFNSSEI